MAEQNREETTQWKLFVGNVPFQCTKEEFTDWWKDKQGFVEAEVVQRFNSDVSRGFGYVTLDSRENMEALLNEQNLQFKNRTLRLSKWEKNTRTKQRGNLVFVRNVPQDADEDEVCKTFDDQWGNVSKCTFNVDKRTGQKLNSCVVEFTDRESYNNALGSKELEWNGSVLNLYRFRDNSRNTNQYNKNPATRAAYKAGFRAGRTLGYQEASKSEA
jgi:nucleolin